METILPETSEYHGPGNGQKKSYSTLYGRFILLTLVCSVVPLLLVGWGIYHYYSKFSTDRMVEYFQSQAQHHERVIELFLKERISDLELIAFSHSLAYLQDTQKLKHIFDIMNRDGSFFEDLGVMNERGRHLAYVGPFDLMDKDYSVTFWYKEVMERSTYVSDMFSGYREVPHFIVAVTSQDGGAKWILRATIYTESFRSLVEDVKMGGTGEVFLVNQAGVLQTSPRFGGKILDKVDLPMDMFSEQSGVRILEPRREGDRDLPRQIVAYTWLKEPRWMLAVKQDYSEVFQQVNHANQAMIVFLHISILAILVVSIITTRHMIQVVKKRDEQAEELNRQLVQASKLASLGELAAGVAHEINNPLAIILTGSQVIRDFADEIPDLDPEFKEQLTECLSQADSQVLRCNLITHNLLRFARRSKSVIEKVNLNTCVGEVIELMEKRAKSSGISFQKELDKDLPLVLSDPSQLQQVFVNLIANAIDAHEGKPYGTIQVATRANGERGGVEMLIADTGSGIPGDILERIFDPFFTTKPVGKGTGLGLSISYSIIKNLGGEIRVRSSVGKGTEFTILLPFRLPEDFRDSAQERKVLR
ncbi:MAG: ATP-binding protein [Syntrophobacteraceae bacterium]